MSCTVERVTLTRRRGDAEKNAENAFESSKAERARRKRRDVGWRHRACTQAQGSLRSPFISADSAIAGFDFLNCVLRVSASPRQIYGLFGSGFSNLGVAP
jgi:hypothetical protein